MKKVLITEFMEQDSVDTIAQKFEVTYNPNLSENTEELASQIGFFDAIIVRNKTQLNGGLLATSNKLRFIGRLGVGLDNIDTKYCENNNIVVQPATGMNAHSVAEYVINCSLSLLKNITLAHQGTVSGKWPRTTIKSRELQGKTMGLLGFGVIGKKVSILAQAFGSRIVAYDPYILQSDADEYSVSLVTQSELFECSDIISVHLPLTDETKNLLDYSSFCEMKNKPIIINSSRGSIVNQTDLIKAYKDCLISGFALDVYESEPVKEKFYNKILNTMNCILTPHTSGVTIESNTRVSQFIAEKVIRFLSADN
jgi:phosphoglycerate dehydrogenase-like enzyme